MVLDRRENASRRQSACTERMWPACSLASLDRSGLQVPPPAHGHCTFPAHHVRSRWMDWSVRQTLRPSRHGEFARSRFHRGRRRALLEYCPATLALCLRPCGLVPSRRGGHGGMPSPRVRPPRPPGDVGVYQCTHGRAHEAVRAVDASLYETGITGCVLGCVARDLSASARPPSRLRGRHFYTSACSTAPWRLRPLLSAYRTHEGAEKHQWGLSAAHSNISCV